MSVRVIRIQAGLAIIIAVGLVLSMFITNPDQLGPFGITIWFIGLFIALANLATLGLSQLARWRGSSLPLAIGIRQGVLTSLWLTALLALSSLHQISLRDVVLISLLVVLIEFYMRRIR